VLFALSTVEEPFAVRRSLSKWVHPKRPHFEAAHFSSQMRKKKRSIDSCGNSAHGKPQTVNGESYEF
jgi:hypothetical protein